VIKENRLIWEAIDLNGEVFDRFEIVKLRKGRRQWTGLPEKPKQLPVPEK
jgi:hypothetical protein